MSTRRAAAVALCAGLFLAACGDSGATPRADAATPRAPTASDEIPAVDERAGRPFTFTTMDLSLVDSTRPTPESPNGPQLASRAVSVRLSVPDGDQPAPLVVFSHGMAGHPDAFDELFGAWAAAGYAVAAPVFPLTNRDAEGSFTNLFDVPGQPGDVSFVVDELLARSADPTDELAGRLDPTRMAAAGLSAGGATTYEVAVNEVGRDPRFIAAIIFSGTRYTNPDNGTFEAPIDHPVFILHGDADPLIALSNAEDAYADLAAPRFFATLLGGGHAGPYQDAGEGIEAQVPGMSDLIRASTIAFLDRYVLGVDDAEAEFVAAVEDPALTVVVADP